MKRLHLFEIEDQDWCPRSVRDAVTDYLQFFFVATKTYTAMIPLLAVVLQRLGGLTAQPEVGGALADDRGVRVFP